LLDVSVQFSDLPKLFSLYCGPHRKLFLFHLISLPIQWEEVQDDHSKESLEVEQVLEVEVLQSLWEVLEVEVTS